MISMLVYLSVGAGGGGGGGGVGLMPHLMERGFNFDPYLQPVIAKNFWTFLVICLCHCILGEIFNRNLFVRIQLATLFHIVFKYYDWFQSYSKTC